MITRFELFRNSITSDGRAVLDRYQWELSIRFEGEERDSLNWDQVSPAVGEEVSFSATGSTYSELAREVFRRRGEIQPMLRVAEDVAGLFWRSRLHFLVGLRSSTWFEELLTVLGLLENFSTFGKTHHKWIESDVVPYNFQLDWAQSPSLEQTLSGKVTDGTK